MGAAPVTGNELRGATATGAAPFTGGNGEALFTGGNGEAPFTGGNGEALFGAAWLGSGAGNAPCAKP
jgi:hypothetical protein